MKVDVKPSSSHWCFLPLIHTLHKVQASAPPFLLSLFLLSNACAFIYLLLAVWLSMHVLDLGTAWNNLRRIRNNNWNIVLFIILSGCAYDEASIASHSFGVRLCTTQLVWRAVCSLCVWPAELTSANSPTKCEAYQICPPADPQHETDSWPEEGAEKKLDRGQVYHLPARVFPFRSTLKDYERQGVANLLRLPFQDDALPKLLRFFQLRWAI